MGIFLKDKISTSSESPGVYIFKDKDNKIIYIGKAAILRNRLMSYLNRLDEKSRILMANARSLDTILTGSDIEALTLEESLIKLHKPKYNIRLKDDKKSPYLKVTINEKYPRILFTRNIKPDGSLIFGPYTNARALRQTRDALCRIFQLVSCEKDITRKLIRPCLEHNLNRCSAPCADKITKEDYGHSVKKAVQFLRGNSDELIKEIEKQMWEYAKNEKFEAAASLRDQLLSVQRISQRHQVVSGDGIDRDIVGLSRSGIHCVACIFRIRENRLVAKEILRLSVSPDDPDDELVAAFIRLIYTHLSYLPEEIVVPIKPAESEIQEKWFQDRGFITRIVVPVSELVGQLLKWAVRNAENELSNIVLKRTVPHVVLELQDLLHLSTPLRWIEAFDISNLGDKWAVGSSVSFKDGRPFKQRYRRYRIRRVKGQNDFAMINEIVGRRLADLKHARELPDLLLIDGGRNQQIAALQAIRHVNIDIPIFALAKRRDQLFYPDGRCVSLPAYSRSAILLKRLQEEAHRFAVNYHRKLRSKEVTGSVLDLIPGVGHARKLVLLKYFGSVDAIKKASEEDISKLPKIGPIVARLIYESLHT
jgi:excinuclease ABC subunit C